MYVIPLIFFRVIPAKPDGILTLKSKYVAASFRELIISLIFYHISSIFQEKSLFSAKIKGFLTSSIRFLTQTRVNFHGSSQYSIPDFLSPIVFIDKLNRFI